MFGEIGMDCAAASPTHASCTNLSFPHPCVLLFLSSSVFAQPCWCSRSPAGRAECRALQVPVGASPPSSNH